MRLPTHRQPIWIEGAPSAHYDAPPPTSADVVVVGGGITGLSVATRLCEAGRDVAVLEMNRIGGGTTGHSTGHLDSHVDENYRAAAKNFGEDSLRLVSEARRAAINQIHRWVHEKRIDCDFALAPGFLYSEKDADTEDLMREFEILERIGAPAEWTEVAPLPFATAAAIRLPDQARFSPLAYVCGLAAALPGPGVSIHEGVRVENITEEEGRCEVETTRGTIRARHVVLAVHSPLFSLVTLETRSSPWQSYVVAARVEDPISDALYWDTMDPYHYTRRASTADPNLLIIGGADHRTGKLTRTEESFDELLEYVHHRYRVRKIEGRWSAEYFRSADKLPYIGRLPARDRVFVATGFAGDGLTYGTVAGILISDMILGKRNPWEEVFDPSRVKPMATARRATMVGLRTARHWIGDRLTGDDYPSPEDVPIGQGGVLTVEGERLAIYRDEHGELHAMSPVCRHAGCYVHWNSAERTWDCPCHGGRYECTGEVISSPPVKNLEPRSLPVETS